MFNDSFDARTVQPQQGFSTHPYGMFDFQITHTYLKPTQDQSGLRFVVELTSQAGRIENGYNIYNKSPQAMEIAQKELSALCHAVGIYRITYPKDAQGNPIFDQAGRELRGGRGRMEVKAQTRKNAEGKFEETGYAEVAKVFDSAGNEPGKAPAAQQNNPAPMQQNGQGGWSQPQPQQNQPTPQNNAPAPAAGGWGGQPQQQAPAPQAQPDNQPQPQGNGEKPPWMR